MMNELHKQTILSKFNYHWMLHTCGFVLSLVINNLTKCTKKGKPDSKSLIYLCNKPLINFSFLALSLLLLLKFFTPA